MPGGIVLTALANTSDGNSDCARRAWHGSWTDYGQRGCYKLPRQVSTDKRACNDWSSQLPCGRVGNYPATGLWESTATDPWLRESKQTLPNLRTWAPCCVLCLITSAAIRADLTRVFRVGHSIMDGFGRQLAGISNTLSNIAAIGSGFDSHRPLHKP